MKYRFSRGFTLLELLTVIAIISVLAAMLFPVYVNAKKSAARAQCQSNLSQIAKAFEMYTSDYNSCYPCTANDVDSNGNKVGQYLWMGRYFRWPMKHYVGYRAGYNTSDPQGDKQTTRVWSSILRCPADPLPGDVYDGTSYGYSAAFYHKPDQVNSMTLTQLYNDPNPSFAVVTTSQVRYPAKKALLADWLAHSDDHSTWWSHSGSRNFAFADGHVTYLNASRIHQAVDGYPDINLTKDGVAGKDID